MTLVMALELSRSKNENGYNEQPIAAQATLPLRSTFLICGLRAVTSWTSVPLQIVSIADSR